MVITDAETNSRTEKEKPEFDDISRSTSATGGEITFVGTEQERVHRESSAGRSIFNPRPTVTGKMLDHLIDEYQDQMASKENEIARLEARVKELKLLREELQKEEPK